MHETLDRTCTSDAADAGWTRRDRIGTHLAEEPARPDERRACSRTAGHHVVAPLTLRASRVNHSLPLGESPVANIQSAEKQNRKMIKHRARNRAAMASLRTAVKKARTAVDDKTNEAASLVKQAVSIIDSAVTKGILKRRTASRYVSRLATRTPPSV